ncbi:hypothetical protein BDW74DRAFT_179108 [Aspergillus multicolor]|uniref:uncharacterized protein n=1 Tax=Aspergillus multicolor TaxID=41759 RepID=UPI003CCE4BC7
MATILDTHLESSNPFTAVIQAYLTTTNASQSAEETATHIVAAHTNPRGPVLRCLTPSAPKNPRSHPVSGNGASDGTPRYRGRRRDPPLDRLPRFGLEWYETRNTLWGLRDSDGVYDREIGGMRKLEISPAESYLYFTIFSAALLKATKADRTRQRKIVSQAINVFYYGRDILETVRVPPDPLEDDDSPYSIPQQQVWYLDVRVTAIWIRDGARALWDVNLKLLWFYYTNALESKTDLWPREDGLERERWELWGRRLRGLQGSDDKALDEDTKAVVAEAADVLEALLQEH